MRFGIKISTTQEMNTTRETLRALGYKIGPAFEKAKGMEDWNCLHVDVLPQGKEVFRGKQWAVDSSRLYESLTDYLDTLFPVKTPSQLELEKLEASAEALNKQIAALKATI